jgi:eukaryotic-like serine/threonine-protein kinase
MEYVNGIALSELVAREGAQSVERTLCLLGQICGSLAEVHGLGMAHRALKPGNVMLSWRGEARDWIRVIDFGLVKLPPALGGVGALAAEEGVFGTPGYAPPEAWTRAERVGERGDVYAIGLIAHFLLTGEAPPASEGAPRSHRALEACAPAWLVDVLKRCLHADPARRYAHGKQLLGALSRPSRARHSLPRAVRSNLFGRSIPRTSVALCPGGAHA